MWRGLISILSKPPLRRSLLNCFDGIELELAAVMRRPSNLAPMLTKKDSTSAVARRELKSAVRAAFRQALSPGLKTSDSINGILTVSAINRSRFTYI